MTHRAFLVDGGEYFGSATQVLALDVLTGDAIRRTAREALGIIRLDPLETFGDWPKVAVRVVIGGNRGPDHKAEGIWVFHLDEGRRIRSLWALWNPAAFLAYGR